MNEWAIFGLVVFNALLGFLVGLMFGQAIGQEKRRSRYDR